MPWQTEGCVPQPMGFPGIGPGFAFEPAGLPELRGPEDFLGRGNRFAI